ncbi:hypothetical protein SBA4_1860015 [Candidatus Sulfopaludibacter sp. SbA4]|nr:hypothetical protein SBA4_1860015 [Candidatus Sulfopaludibacter sp. SbA4]
MSSILLRHPNELLHLKAESDMTAPPALGFPRDGLDNFINLSITLSP